MKWWTSDEEQVGLDVAPDARFTRRLTDGSSNGYRPPDLDTELQAISASLTRCSDDGCTTGRFGSHESGETVNK